MYGETFGVAIFMEIINTILVKIFIHNVAVNRDKLYAQNVAGVITLWSFLREENVQFQA